MRLIGDCETAALVGRDGSIDWLCWPAFDSDACFAALLGTNKHGRWLIAPERATSQAPRAAISDNTLILETRFETADGAVALIDFMPPRGKASDVVRLVRGVSGTGQDADATRDPLRLRRRHSLGARRTTDSLLAICRPGHDGAAHAGRDPRRGPDHR